MSACQTAEPLRHVADLCTSKAIIIHCSLKIISCWWHTGYNAVSALLSTCNGAGNCGDTEHLSTDWRLPFDVHIQLAMPLQGWLKHKRRNACCVPPLHCRVYKKQEPSTGDREQLEIYSDLRESDADTF